MYNSLQGAVTATFSAIRTQKQTTPALGNITMSNLARRRRKSKAKYDDVDGGKNNGATAVWSIHSHSHHYSELTINTRYTTKSCGLLLKKWYSTLFVRGIKCLLKNSTKLQSTSLYSDQQRTCLTPSFILLFKKNILYNSASAAHHNPTTKPNEILFKWKKWVLSMSVYTNFIPLCT